MMLLPGGHATFGTGRAAFAHSLPGLSEWIASHSDARLETERTDGD
jgi:hypothetical protein